MADYIEKEAAKEAILSWAVCINHPELLSKEDAMHCIDNLPAADVAPVRHGRLVSTGYDELYCEFGDCTICGADNPISSRYCRQCGAKMDLEG